MRTAFPDVRFEVHELLAEGDVVACRSTMTGTHLGHLGLVPPGLDATGRRIEIAHMYFFRFADGRVSDLWHLWDTPGLLRQLGASPQATR
jgi:predicted ester cyclase